MDTIVAGTFSADPLFVAYPSDLHLGLGSPCEGAGTPVGAPAVDFDGVVRSGLRP